MSVVSVKEKATGRRSEIGEAGRRTEVRSFIVICNDAADGPATAVTADDGVAQIPTWGDPHPVATACLVSNIVADPVAETDLHFDVTVTYTTPTGASTPEEEDPLDRPDEVSWGGTEETEPYWRDTQETIDWPMGRPMTTSAGEAFAQFLERDTGKLVLTITGNRSTGNPALDEEYSRTVNSNEVEIEGVTFDAGMLYMKPIQGQKVIEGDHTYYRKTWTIVANRDGWKQYVEDRGFYEEAPGGKLKLILDKDGVPVKTPWPLDGDGAAEPNATDAAASLEFVPYKEKSWSPIGFDS